MPHAGRFAGGQLQGMVLVIVPSAQIDRITFARCFGHPEHIHEKTKAFRRLWGQELQMAKMCQVKNWLFPHSMILQPLLRETRSYESESLNLTQEKQD